MLNLQPMKMLFFKVFLICMFKDPNLAENLTNLAVNLLKNWTQRNSLSFFFLVWVVHRRRQIVQSTLVNIHWCQTLVGGYSVYSRVTLYTRNPVYNVNTVYYVNTNVPCILRTLCTQCTIHCVHNKVYNTRRTPASITERHLVQMCRGVRGRGQLGFGVSGSGQII